LTTYAQRKRSGWELEFSGWRVYLWYVCPILD